MQYRGRSQVILRAESAQNGRGSEACDSSLSVTGHESNYQVKRESAILGTD